MNYFVVISEESICVGLARVGKIDQKIISGTIKQLSHIDFGSPLHSFVIPGKTHELEDEFLQSISLSTLLQQQRQ
jgi:diphthine synthase